MVNKDYIFLQLFRGEKSIFQERFISLLAKLINTDRVNLHTEKLKWRANLSVKRNGLMRGVYLLESNTIKMPTITHKFILKNDYPTILVLEDILDLVMNDPKNYIKSKGYIEKLLASSSIRKIIVPNRAIKNSLMLHYGRNLDRKIEVFYSIESKGNFGEDLEFENRKYDFCFINENFILSAGAEMVRAFERLCERYDNLKLCMVTNLDMARYYLGDLSRNPNIIWKHYDHNVRNVNNFLKDSNVYIMPNSLGDFSSHIIEALEAGCIIVTPNYEGYDDFNAVGKNGFLLRTDVRGYFPLEMNKLARGCFNEEYFSLLHRDNLVSEIQRVMSDIVNLEESRGKMMFNSRQLFEERFSRLVWERRMRELLIESFPQLGLAKILSNEIKAERVQALI
jgi:glycosyltransferase involved in cell wall biosynthesis